MKKAKPLAREQFVGPLVLVLVGVVVVGVIGYFGRSARRTPPPAAPPTSESAPAPAAKSNSENQTLPARYRAADAPPNLVVAFDPVSAKGDKKAPVVLVEFSDYQ
jgi:hypothetical protein